jgi:hypothetical protein
MYIAAILKFSSFKVPLVNYISPVVSWLSSGAFIENHYIIVLEREWKSSIALVLFVYFSRIH